MALARMFAAMLRIRGCEVPVDAMGREPRPSDGKQGPLQTSRLPCRLSCATLCLPVPRRMA
eukprot:13834669-Alexandrium_andersonii.AAC.1